MNNDITREEFEQAINEIMGEWFTILSHYDCSGFSKTLSCRPESGENYKYHVFANGTEYILTCDSDEALEVYNSIKR